jgi:hypothetical protein
VADATDVACNPFNRAQGTETLPVYETARPIITEKWKTGERLIIENGVQDLCVQASSPHLRTLTSMIAIFHWYDPDQVDMANTEFVLMDVDKVDLKCHQHNIKHIQVQNISTQNRSQINISITSSSPTLAV